MNNDLLKEAIADAKAVRETALANARIALEEAFTPRLQSMLSAKLAEDDEMDYEEEAPVADEVPVEEPVEAPVEEAEYEEDMEEEAELDMEEPVAEEEGMEDDLELEAIIKELEGEMDEEEAVEEPVADEAEGEEEVNEAEEDEDISLEEIISALREEDEAEEDTDEEGPALEEAYTVIKFLKGKINEVNLLNAKLLFSNKLFRNYEMNESQKMKVIENFDRASNLREVKLIFSTLCESFNLGKSKRQIKESYASKPAGRSTAPKKEILSEGNDLAARWKKLANLK